MSDDSCALAWSEFLLQKYPDVTHFCGAEPYVEMMAKLQKKKFIQIPRILDFKASKITAFSNLDQAASFRIQRELVPKILITGIESSGKSTISVKLAAALKAELVVEYGRIHTDIMSGILE